MKKIFCVLFLLCFFSGKFGFSAENENNEIWKDYPASEAKENSFDDGPSPVWGLSITPDEKEIITTDRQGTLFFWSLEKGELKRSFDNSKNNLFANRTGGIAICPNGKSVAAVIPSSDYCQSTLWEISSGKAISELRDLDTRIFPPGERQFEGAVAPTSLVFSNDGEFLVGGLENKSPDNDAVLFCWNARTGKLLTRKDLKNPECDYVRIAHHPIYPLVAVSVNREILFFEVPTFKIRSRGPWSKKISLATNPFWISFSKNGTILGILSNSDDRKEQSFYLAYPDNDKPSHAFQLGGKWVLTAVLSSNGEFLFTAGLYGRVAIWQLNNCQLLRTWKGHSSHVRGLALANHDKFLISGSDSGGEDVGLSKVSPMIKIWEISSGKILREFLPK